VSHPEYGRYITELVSPIKSLKKMVIALERRTARHWPRSLQNELIKN
jgi:hypothetical protein